MTHERGVPPQEAIRNTLQASIACAIANNLTLHDINGHADEWCRHLRNEHGDRPTTDDFFAEWTRQMTEKSKQACPEVDDE